MCECVINANMGTTYEMLCNLDQALEHHEKVRRGRGGRGEREKLERKGGRD